MNNDYYNRNNFLEYGFRNPQMMDMYGMQNMMNNNMYMPKDMMHNMPTVFNVHKMSESNMNFKSDIWHGKYMQVSLMHINPGESLKIDMRENQDQFIHIFEGQGLCLMGDSPDNLNYKNIVSPGSCIIVPAGKYHDLINNGLIPIKCFSIYSPTDEKKDN